MRCSPEMQFPRLNLPVQLKMQSPESKSTSAICSISNSSFLWGKELVLPATYHIQRVVINRRARKMYEDYRDWKRYVRAFKAGNTSALVEPSAQPDAIVLPTLPTPRDTSTRPKAVKMAIQPPRTLPSILARACGYTIARYAPTRCLTGTLDGSMVNFR